jgi:hypothetical protein
MWSARRISASGWRMPRPARIDRKVRREALAHFLPGAAPVTATTVQAREQAPSKDIHRSSQGAFCCWHGLNVAGWRQLRRMNPPWSPGKRWRWHSITATTWANAWHEWCEAQVFGRRIAQTDIAHPPLFVLGHWRSGTTLLHELFTLDPQFTYPNMFQVLFPGHFLFTERWITALTAWAVPKTRPMDKMSAHWKMPQEDELALLTRTFVSPYMMLAFQGQRERYGRFFDLTEITPEERDLWIREFRLFLKKLTVRENKPIVLKSPSHTYRVPLLLELFPQARFVYIYRDPYAVYSSSLHLRRTIFAENALGEPNYEGLEDDMMLTYEKCIDRYESTKALVPPGQLSEVRFEDLEADPVGEMRRIYRELNLPGWDAAEPALQSRMPAHASYRKNKFSLDPVTTRKIYDRWERSFALYGYDSRLSSSSPDFQPQPK